MMRLLVVAIFLVVSAACDSADDGGFEDTNDGGTGGIDGTGGTGGEDTGGGGTGGIDGTGGTGGTGGGGTGGEGATCESFEPCGGDPVGTWEVVETCAPEEGRAPFAPVTGCMDVPYTFRGFISGTYTFESTKWIMDVKRMGIETWTLSNACLSALGVSCAAMGFDFEFNGDGECMVKTENRSIRGTVAYLVNGTNIRTPGAIPEFTPFCVRGDYMDQFDEFGDITLLLERR